MLIITEGGRSTRLSRQSFQDEAALQRYISAHPEAIPLSEADDQPRLHVLGREFPTSSGRIDILGTDSDGHAYLIETKLYKNPDKRLVLAQVLDYGAALWAAAPAVDSVLDSLRQDAVKRGTPEPLAALAAFLGTEESGATEHLDKFCSSLAEGRFTALILMDRLEDRLRDLIRFMNENSRFLVLAVELDYYRHGDTELVYPRLFGTETRRPVAAGRKGRREQDPEVFMDQFAASFGAPAADAWRSLEAAVRARSIPGVGIGHRPMGAPYISLTGTAVGEIRLLVLSDQGEIRDYLHTANVEADPGARSARQKFRERLVESVPGAMIGGSAGRAYVPLISAAQHREAVISAITDLAREIPPAQVQGSAGQAQSSGQTKIQ